MQSQQVDNMFDLPQELCAKPLALITATGLDTLNNAVHKTIWDAFSSNRRSDRAPIQFKLISSAHLFPVVKPKRNSYEWYIPKGILKRNWMNKYLNEIPAVMVLFYDLDWNDLQWNEKLIECSSRVQSMRAALEGRSTRIIVVLIQQTAPLPASEDLLAAERANSLCASCDLNTKHLFVLPHGDHLHGYAARLENAFYDLAQGFYQFEMRNIKSHKEHLNKTTHQYLFVRHQFKIAFLNELKQDNHTANKHYLIAYNNLQEVRMVDTNALEIRTVAGFINYKLCKVLFGLSIPKEAISQFRTHIERYKARTGFRELVFEHHAWIAQQFSIFGDLFDEAIRLGCSPAVQTLHPGFYYEQAAFHATLRKQGCHELCSDKLMYPSPDPLEGALKLEHYGQRPWRPGRLSAEPPDPALEKAAIQALQWKERHTVNHSAMIISLYGNAISQFKTYRCPRMRRHLAVQMAEEYYNSGDYGKALTLLSHMLWDYRTERWWSVLAVLLKKALCCAYITANIQDYIQISIEMLSDTIPISSEEKNRILNNLNKVLQKTIPNAEPDIPANTTVQAEQLWKSTIVKISNASQEIDMNNISSCLHVKANFVQNSFTADKAVDIEIYVSSNCCQVLQFNKLSVIINSPNKTFECQLAENQQTLRFEKNCIEKFQVQYLPDLSVIEKQIQIGSVLLTLGDPSKKQVVLKFTGTGSEALVSDSTYKEFLYLKRTPSNVPDFYSITPQVSAQIVCKPSKLNVEITHSAPALISEWYPVKILVKNQEDGAVKDLVLEINIKSDESGLEQTELTRQFPVKLEKLPLKVQMPDIGVNDATTLEFLMRAHKEGARVLSLKFLYTVIRLDSSTYPCVKEEDLFINAIKPFDCNINYNTARFQPMLKCFVGEPFVVCTQISNTSECTLYIEKTVMEFTLPFKYSNKNIDNTLKNLKLQIEEAGSELFMCISDKECKPNMSVGYYNIYWKRIGSKGPVVCTQIALPIIETETATMKIDLSLPSTGVVRTPISVTYCLTNKTTGLIQLDLNMDASDAFMFAGYKQKQIAILPETHHLLNYTLYPLMPGYALLPKLKLTIPEKVGETQNMSIKQSHIFELLERSLPTHIYILPQVRGNPSLVENEDFPKSSFNPVISNENSVTSTTIPNIEV